MRRIIHDFFNENDFIHVDTPIITSNDCEGGGDIFHIKVIILMFNVFYL